MPTSPPPSPEQAVLATLTCHRVATAEQLATLMGRNVVALRRILVRLEKVKRIRRMSAPRGSRGAPPALFMLNDAASGVDAAPAPAQRAHAAMTTTIAAAAAQAVRQEVGQAIEFHRPTAIRPWADAIAAKQPAHVAASFVPDAVFTVRQTEPARCLLFLVEADTGSEPLASGQADRSAIAAKIINYQAAFASAAYRTAVPALPLPPRGFRLLLVTQTPRREQSLGELLRLLKPTDFVWTTHEQLVVGEGFTNAIWLRGGGAASTSRQRL